MMINKVYKFRLYPSDMRKIVIHKIFGCSKLLYNKMLSLKNEDNNLTSFDMSKLIPDLKNEYPFLSENVVISSEQQINAMQVYVQKRTKKFNEKDKGK